MDSFDITNVDNLTFNSGAELYHSDPDNGPTNRNHLALVNYSGGIQAKHMNSNSFDIFNLSPSGFTGTDNDQIASKLRLVTRRTGILNNEPLGKISFTSLIEDINNWNSYV
jgi:hypothetical protein